MSTSWAVWLCFSVYLSQFSGKRMSLFLSLGVIRYLLLPASLASIHLALLLLHLQLDADILLWLIMDPPLMNDVYNFILAQLRTFFKWGAPYQYVKLIAIELVTQILSDRFLRKLRYNLCSLIPALFLDHIYPRSE